MLSDFCHSLWDTHIECDVVSSDGYEVSNLISRDKPKKLKGFLAARFVKPVVSILLSFPFPVDLFTLNINPQVGAQKAYGFEIFSASLKPRAENCSSENVKQSLRSKAKTSSIDNGGEISRFHFYEHELNVSNAKQEYKDCFVQVLRVRIPEGNVGHFVNPCFRCTSQVESESSVLKCGNVHKCMLQHGRLLRHVSHLMIRITQVHRGSVPCIGAVEVVGQPAQNCGTFVMNYARIITSRLQLEKQEVCNGFFAEDRLDGESLHTSNVDKKIENAKNFADNCIPEDFIDPITLNIMTLPVLLPCGTTVDNTTLERHINSEKTWGRPPSDPFTGLPLGSKVVPNAALKCRIDNFLLSSGINVSNLGRTVGSLSGCQSTTKLKFDAVQDRTAAKTGSHKSKRTLLVRDTDEIQPPPKKCKSRDSQSNSHLSDSLDQALEAALSVRRQSCGSNQNISVSSFITSQGSNGSAIPSGSTGRPKNSEENSEDRTSSGCCHRQQSNTLFQLPCQHVICRDCLTYAVKRNLCPACQKTFNKKNVMRVYSTNARN